MMKTRPVLRMIALAGLLLVLLLGTASAYAQETITFGEGETSATIDDGSLAAAEEVDLYQLEVSAGQTLAVEVTEGFNLSVKDVEADSMLLAFSANARTFSQAVSSTGMYEIGVGSDTDTGDYTLTVSVPPAEEDSGDESGTGTGGETDGGTETVNGFYTVVQGDTLYSIALKFETTVSALQSANGMGAGTLIYAGQQLYIPGTDAPSGVRVYTVQAGDTLYSIATRFGTTVAALQSANGLTGTQINVGQQLSVLIGTGGPGTRTYTVQAGDTLYGIGRQFGVTAQELEALNDIAASGYIYPGQVLQIPSAATYTVRAGDTLRQIAATYATTVEALAALNGIANPNLIYPGQELLIP